MLTAGLVSLQGCKHDKEKTAVLAQVGTSTLTLSELRESFPVEFEQLIRREQYLDFVKRWIDDEVIYQQAQKAELAKDSSVARKLARVRRKLLIEEFLARENASDVFEPDEMSMNQYYEMHKEDFRRKVPEVKFIHLRAQSMKQAADLRNKINHGDFLAVAAAGSLDPVPESYASIGFKKQSEFPPCLTQEIASAGIGAVTPPIACPDGFYLVKVLERQEAGSLIPFPEAKEEISGILVMDRKDKLLEGRIAKYKEGLAIAYNLDQIPGQSETSKPGDAQTAPAPKADNAAANAPAAQPNHTETTASAMAAAMPREPAQEKPAPQVSRRSSTRSRRSAYHPSSSARAAAADTAGTRGSSPSVKAAEPAAEPASTSSTGARPEAEENSNAQKPEETP